MKLHSIDIAIVVCYLALMVAELAALSQGYDCAYPATAATSTKNSSPNGFIVFTFYVTVISINQPVVKRDFTGAGPG